ncbi:hypothetical protein [Bradyrhizobium sp.]|uniref:hypothetical protein n=1 Tax=Bradyrhizobium sp. TaxID=376 RepID=UPI0039E28B40
MRARARAPELIECHDCGQAVSFSAASCPNCGSREPAGPYAHSERELRRLRGEARNDRTLIVSVVGCGLLGAAFGGLTASGSIMTIVGAAFYGLIGVLLGAPVGFVINMTRHLGRH